MFDCFINYFELIFFFSFLLPFDLLSPLSYRKEFHSFSFIMICSEFQSSAFRLIRPRIVLHFYFDGKIPIDWWKELNRVRQRLVSCDRSSEIVLKYRRRELDSCRPRTQLTLRNPPDMTTFQIQTDRWPL